MKLINVTIFKYKCIETEQSFKVEDDITILVGMNESGKTSLLEALAKTNYFLKEIISNYIRLHFQDQKFC